MGRDHRLRVLATTPMIASIVKEIGQDAVVVHTLIGQDLDPHSYELVKGDGELFRHADLIFANGLGLEHGASLQRQLQKDQTVFLGDLIHQKNPDSFLRVEFGLDPHFWMDMSLFSQIIPPIVEVLSQKAPSSASSFIEKGEALSEELLSLDLEIQKKLLSIPDEKRHLVTSHDAFGYFTRRYLATEREIKEGEWEERVLSPEGLAPSGELGPFDIQKIIDYIEKHDLRVLFLESNVSKDSLEKISDACRIKGRKIRLSSRSLFGDSMESDEPGSYQRMLLHNASVIEEELLSDGCNLS